jgi:2-polyprenyl-3-methyl-5-hydroxy-6-metoxy-1,4-benzoquinol methylase
MVGPQRNKSMVVMALFRQVDLTHRSKQVEWLDGNNIDPIELEDVLRDLARFNKSFLGHYPVLEWLSRATADVATGVPLTIIDVGCGYGDLLRAIRCWSRRRNLNLTLRGIDLNPETVRIAKAATDPADQIEFKVMNIFELPQMEQFDFIVSSLVAHHLTDQEIVEFLTLMEKRAHRGWFIYDLQRHHFLYRFIGLVGRFFRLHPMVIKDGQLSVSRSLTRGEWRERIAAANIPPSDLSIRWFMFRHSIERLQRKAVRAGGASRAG